MDRYNYMTVNKISDMILTFYRYKMRIPVYSNHNTQIRKWLGVIQSRSIIIIKKGSTSIIVQFFFSMRARDQFEVLYHTKISIFTFQSQIT